MICAKRTLIDDDGGTRKDYRRTFLRGCLATLPEESPEQHASYSFSLIHGIVSLGSRLTPDKSARNSSKLHALCRSLVLGQPQDKANAYVLYSSGTRRAQLLSNLVEYTLSSEDNPETTLGQHHAGRSVHFGGTREDNGSKPSLRRPLRLHRKDKGNSRTHVKIEKNIMEGGMYLRYA
ncbi:hypothetical protein Tco_0422717 [Tanacetum coccineum]